MAAGEDFFQGLVKRGQEPGHKLIIFTDYNKKEEENYPNTISRCFTHIKHIKKEGKFNQTFLTNIAEGVMGQMMCWKKSRGDGNCYYRAVMSTYLIKICFPYLNLRWLEFFRNAVYNLPDNRVHPDFINAKRQFNQLLSEIYANTRTMEGRYENFRKMHIMLQDNQFDLAMVRLSRFITVMTFYNKLEDPEFSAFILDDEKDMIIQRMFEMGKEAEGVDLAMLPEGLGIVVSQVNIFEKAITTRYPDEPEAQKLVVNIICKSKGHYDILYSKQEMEIERYNPKERCFYYILEGSEVNYY